MALTWRTFQSKLRLRPVLLVSVFVCALAAWWVASSQHKRLLEERHESELQYVTYSGGRATIDPETDCVYNANVSSSQTKEFENRFRGYRVISLSIFFPKSEDLEFLSRLDGLKRLGLEAIQRGTPLGEMDLAKLSECKSLESLRIDNPLASGAVLGLRGCKSLRSLNLKGVRADLRMLADLKSLQQLEELKVEASHLSEVSLQELRQALPNCAITVERPTLGAF